MSQDRQQAADGPPLDARTGSATDPDLGEIGPGHVCKHGVRWPHPCVPCDDAAWEFHLRQSPNAEALPPGGKGAL